MKLDLPTHYTPRLTSASALLCGLASLLLVCSSPAATINWDVPCQISAEGDVYTAGTLVGAYNFGGPATTVNGVNFGAFPVGSMVNTQGNFTISSPSGLVSSSDTSSMTGDFSSLSSSYQAFLGSAAVSFPGSTLTLDLSGLVVGQTYTFEAWVNDSQRDFSHGFPVAVTGGAGEVDADRNTSGTLGGLGELVIGSFVADGTTQQITFEESEIGGLVNGFQLRMGGSTSVPDTGTTLGLFAIALAGLAFLPRKLRAARGI